MKLPARGFCNQATPMQASCFPKVTDSEGCDTGWAQELFKRRAQGWPEVINGDAEVSSGEACVPTTLRTNETISLRFWTQDCSTRLEQSLGESRLIELGGR